MDSTLVTAAEEYLPHIDKLYKVKEQMDQLNHSVSDKVQNHLYTLDTIREKKDLIKKACVLDLTDDMYCGSLDTDTISDFVCLLCYGIVMDPVQCLTCSAMVCRQCQIQNKSTECVKKCGSSSFKPGLGLLEQKIYDSLLFRCVNETCQERIPLRNYRSHVTQKCQVKTFPRLILANLQTTNQVDVFTTKDDYQANPFEHCFERGDLDSMFDCGDQDTDYSCNQCALPDQSVGQQDDHEPQQDLIKVQAPPQAYRAAPIGHPDYQNNFPVRKPIFNRDLFNGRNDQGLTLEVAVF